MEFEIRADGLHIEGYVNAVERDSRVVIAPECGRCVEQIRAGAFAEALRAAENVDLLLNHDRGHKAGSTLQGNLRLTEDNIGLRASADISDGEIIEKAKAGLLKGWSFGFTAKDTTIEQRAEGVPRRHVNSLVISEVSIIDDRFTPCYAGTSIEVRADGEELIETRFNPYHDPVNGRFTDGTGGNMGGVLYVGKGEKGKGVYTFAKEYSGTDNPEFAKRNKSFIKENNRLSNHYPQLFESGDLTKDEFDEAMSELVYDIRENDPYLMKDSNGGFLKTTGTVFNYQGKSYGYNNIKGRDYITDISTSAFIPVTSNYYVPFGEAKNDVLHAVQKLRDTLVIASEFGRRADPDLSDYIKRYNKTVLDGYKIRAALLDVPP